MLSLLLVAQVATAVPEAACTAADARCTQFVTLKGGPARSLVYTTYPLDRRNDRIRRALIIPKQ